MNGANTRIGFSKKVMVGLFASLLFLSGCAGIGRAGKEAGMAKTGGSQATPGVKGFTITEDAKIDSESQADFKAAVEALNAGDTEKGVDLLQKVTKRSPNAVAPYINLAIAYIKLDKLDLAEENLKTALKLNPDHPVANNEYGMLYRKTGRFAEAKATYEKILAKYPDFQPARKNLGVLCDLYLRDEECALKQYEEYSAAVPGDKPVSIWIADLKQRLGK